MLEWTQLRNAVSSEGHVRDDRTLILISVTLVLLKKNHTCCFLKLQGTATTTKKSEFNEHINQAAFFFFFESEGKAVPLMKIKKALTDSFLS